MSLLIINVLATGVVVGALISSSFVATRSPILSDRLILAGIGALMGLLVTIAVLTGWHLVSIGLAMMEGSQ